MIKPKFHFPFIFIILFFACTDAPLPSMPEEPEVSTFTFLALGDSYTIGQGVEEVDSWPFQLQRSLETEDVSLTEVKVIAKTGWTTNNLLNAIETEDPKNYDLVSLSIGVNNQFQGLSFSEFQATFDSLLQIAIDLAESKDRVFVVSIPDYGVTPFGANNSETIAMELDDYNAYIESKCADAEIPFINITPISRTLGDGPDALASDNLHPSGYQYGLWVEEILPVVLDFF